MFAVAALLGPGPSLLRILKGWPQNLLQRHSHVLLPHSWD